MKQIPKETAAVLVEVKGISKGFPGVKALSGVDLTIRAGEVHALTGENGSGKSTLSKVIAGMHRPDEGTIRIDGEICELETPADAIARGIVMISQELTLAPTLTVAENIFMGRLPKSSWGKIDWSRLRADAVQVLDRLGVHVDPNALVSDLSIELQQEIEIARALSTDARLLILDEATSSLSEAATKRLLELVVQERDKGMAVLMITHRMPEIYAVSSVATVLRDGCLISTVPIPQTSEEELVRLMVGRELGDYYSKQDIAPGELVLDVKALAAENGTFAPTDLVLRRGEILGLAGLAGSGKSEFAQALGGAITARGQVQVAGKPMALGDPRATIRAGVGYVPDDRKGCAILPVRNIAENFAMAWMDRLTRNGLISLRRQKSEVASAIQDYGVVTASADTLISTLSGGNQQKIVLGRIVRRQPDILVLNEPTRGVDVGAKTEIYKMLQRAAKEGAGIIVISSELPEILGISDRIAVFFEGRIVAEFDGPTADEEAIAHAAVAGVKRHPQPTVTKETEV
ncbi:sugar ABC transporter ATP-binding protein [Phaeobacter sp. HF9A]|uniref:sugar ABC transporter ATP-binding protein n=1 Tax=Phaeobacter sp. HF9A TaxID=2721561 RepID=UPI0014309A27|nr:sugar ABC transporter ATP-binding protein [Phaeobacter sp. HF9A]NIZ12072.1 sugar ABC transporter ATP-binding protein [Phaeobacter sp. HF9A]